MTEYKITNLKDLLNIPVDRVDDCLDELKDGLKLMNQNKDKLLAEHKTELLTEYKQRKEFIENQQDMFE